MRNVHLKKMDLVVKLLKGEWDCLSDQSIIDSWTNEQKQLMKYYCLRHVLEKQIKLIQNPD